MTDLIPVGFWKAESWGDRERVTEKQQQEILAAQRKEVEDCIAPEWNTTEEAQACVKYMQDGEQLTGYFGFAIDRIDNITHLGTHDMMTPDGKYIYPEKWERYILAYSVKPLNEQFILDAMAYVKSDSFDSYHCWGCGQLFHGKGLKRKKVRFHNEECYDTFMKKHFPVTHTPVYGKHDWAIEPDEQGVFWCLNWCGAWRRKTIFAPIANEDCRNNVIGQQVTQTQVDDLHGWGEWEHF